MTVKKVANVKIHTMNEKEEIIKEIRALLDKLEKSEVKAKSAEEKKKFEQGRPNERPS